MLTKTQLVQAIDRLFTNMLPVESMAEAEEILKEEGYSVAEVNVTFLTCPTCGKPWKVTVIFDGLENSAPLMGLEASCRCSDSSSTRAVDLTVGDMKIEL